MDGKGDGKKDMDEVVEEFEERRRCPCWYGSPKSCASKIDNWCMIGCGIGAMFAIISCFMVSWRYDPIGTSQITSYFDMSFPFQSRGYGIIYVRGSWSQSWVTIADAACQMRNIGQITALAANAVKLVSNGDCAGSESCQSGFASNMHTRCRAYEKLSTYSLMTLAGTWIACILCMAAGLLAGLSKRKRAGGISFGLFFFAAMMMMLSNLLWTFTSMAQFNELGRTAWYPYPSLGSAWYLHTIGYVMILICNGIYGHIVMPTVWAFDPVEAKIKKMEKRIERKNKKEAAFKAKKEELKNIIANGGMAPGPPGPYGMPPGGAPGMPPMQYGMPQMGGMPPQGPYGVAPPPQPVPMGFQHDGPPTQGMGGAPIPQAQPGDFGINSGGGYPQQYGEQWQGQYANVPPSSGDFGVNGPNQQGGGDFGVNGPPQQQMYQAAPQQEYGAAPAAAGQPQPKQKFNWPAAAQTQTWN